MQQLDGQPVLTWWQGYTNNGSGRGEGVILNSQYQQIATVQAGNGLQGMDLHEFLVTPQGDAYIVGVSPVHYPGMGRPLMDAVVQEIDIKTGLVLFEWHALDHVPISESFFKKGAPGFVFDPYHLNSVVARYRRQPDRVDAQHLGRLQGRPPDRSGDLDARLEPEQLQDGTRDEHRVPARRARAAQRHVHGVR